MSDDLIGIPLDPCAATRHLLDKLLTEIHPIITELRSMIQDNIGNYEDASKINEVFTLCMSQITKCLLNLFDIFRLEYSRCTILQESRQCNLERLSWCLERLNTLHKHLENHQNQSQSNQSVDESFNVTPLYFVNWIDHAFENLNKLSEVVYTTNYKETKELYEMWKNEMVECISGLHISIDELLLCAMTLCRYCLPGDQHIVKARCQVVLRETKALLSELVTGDVSSTIKATTDSLKLPVMPSNVNVTIDVLKDVLYVLETNTNTALLGLLIHCFSNNASPVDVLRSHFAYGCSCDDTDKDGEDCKVVKEFDFYNERLLQIGSFAVSCSSDQSRILLLRSGLASLEALDPHLVPALMTSPDSCHSTLLIRSWRQEVLEIRDSVFLIVDPAAFADKSKQIMHQKLLDALKEEKYNNSSVCSVIGIGSVVYEFFNVYMQSEPGAISHREDLLPLLTDLEKVLSECKIVSNLLSSDDDFSYDIKTPSNKTVSLDQLNKRLKLLYTLVGRINTLLQPNENDQLLDDEESKNATHTIAKNGVTYENSPRKNNQSRSLFARTNVRSSTRNAPLSKLTKHLRTTELNFSVQLDELFNISNTQTGNTTFVNKRLDNVKEALVLFNFSPIKNRSSLRKVVLNRHLQSNKGLEGAGDNGSAKESLLNENENMQLSEVLNEINDMTSILSTPKSRKGVFTRNDTNILSQTINNPTTSKRVWNIPVNASLEMLNETQNLSVNYTLPSNVTTLERITDLDFVEEKLNSLKSQMETSL